MIPMKPFVAGCVLSLVLVVSGCMGGRHPWTAAPLQGPGMLVQPTSVYSQGRILFVRTDFVNQGPVPITVNRDGAQLIMPDGRAVTRGQGAYTQHTPYVIMPGATHAVWVDFRSEGWNWGDIPGAQVNWSGAVTVNGQPVALPPMPVVAAR